MKYIDAEKLLAEIELQFRSIENATGDYAEGRRCELENLNKLIASLQQDKDVLDLCSRVWWEDRGWMMIPPNITLKGLESLLERVRHKIKWNEENGIKEQERPEPTCKSCGFYENNCPFIRNTFKPYPNRVCKDYTYSVMKEQEQEQAEVDLEKEIEKEWKRCNPIDEGMGVESAYIHIEAFDIIARHFYELGLNARKEE